MQHCDPQYPFSIAGAESRDLAFDTTVQNQTETQISKILVSKFNQTSLPDDWDIDLSAISDVSNKILKTALDFGFSVEEVLTLLEEALARVDLHLLDDAEKLSADLVAYDKELVP